MQKVTGRALAADAFALTVRRLPALLASAAVFAVIFGVAVVLPMSYAESRLAASADLGLFGLVVLASFATWFAFAAFQWCWLKALTGGTPRDFIAFPRTAGFWKYLGLIFPSLLILFIITGAVFARFFGPVALGFGYIGIIGIGSLVPFLLNLLLISALLRWHLALCHVVATGSLAGFGSAWRAARAANLPLLGWSAILALLLVIWDTLQAFLQMTTSAAPIPAVMLIEIALGLLLLAIVNVGLLLVYRRCRGAEDVGGRSFQKQSLVSE